MKKSQCFAQASERITIAKIEKTGKGVRRNRGKEKDAYGLVLPASFSGFVMYSNLLRTL